MGFGRIDRKKGLREGDTREESDGSGSWGSSYDDNTRLKLLMEAGGPEAAAAFMALQIPRPGTATAASTGGLNRDNLLQTLNGVGRGLTATSDLWRQRSGGGHSPSGGGGMGSSPVAKPQMRQARDYWRENYDHNFERENRRKDMDLEQMYKDKEMQNKLSMITNFLGSRGMKGGNVTESSTDEQFINNAGAYQPVTTHSTSSRNILSDILGRLF